jgi:hypothetical protein
MDQLRRPGRARPALVGCHDVQIGPRAQRGISLASFHEFDLLMQAIKPVAEVDRDALLKEIAAELTARLAVGCRGAGITEQSLAG